MYNMHEITAGEIKELIIKILNFGKLILSNHAKTRMSERNYSINDIRHILKNGQIFKINAPEKGIYRCEVHGDDLEGDSGKISIELNKNREIVVITVLGGV